MNYLPKPYTKFQKEFPHLNEVYHSLALACHSAGPLDERARRLVKLGIAIGCQSEGAVKSHARRAMEMGVSPEEVRHAVLLSMTTIGFPGMIAALRWLDEVVEARG
ncbi:MAG: carboxymuconolactone decarboxylase family protein [Chloroflexi bacterium]|nr:carboxymuconolactone decarboxylase family protein [Chloroflexota bacterium]